VSGRRLVSTLVIAPSFRLTNRIGFAGFAAFGSRAMPSGPPGINAMSVAVPGVGLLVPDTR
jgi:hypothetical protein